MSDEPASTGPAQNPRPGPLPAAPSGVPPSELRGRTDLATILATEHWSLLGTRSMTWGEIMSRITIHLTVSSALLVVLALIGQLTGFGMVFRGLSIGFATAVLIMGTLTEVRVLLASSEDRQLILAMNRLRRAYVDLAPEVAPYLTASTHDDGPGLMATYTLGTPRRVLTHVVGSTAFFVTVVNTLVATALGALIASALGAPAAAVVAAGAGLGLVWLVGQIAAGRSTGQIPGDVRFPTPS